MTTTTYLQPTSRRKLVGLAGVVVLHVLILVALQAGLHRTVAQKLPPVVQALLLEEKRSEPPPRAAPVTRTAAGVNVTQCDKPEYPVSSKRMEEEGTVTLRFLVGTDGKVIQSEIEKSSGFKRLDEAARAGLAKCQFRPAMTDGKPEQSWTTIKYLWRLE